VRQVGDDRRLNEESSTVDDVSTDFNFSSFLDCLLNCSFVVLDSKLIVEWAVERRGIEWMTDAFEKLKVV
jgi:hypothetical protein